MNEISKATSIAARARAIAGPPGPAPLQASKAQPPLSVHLEQVAQTIAEVAEAPIEAARAAVLGVVSGCVQAHYNTETLSEPKPTTLYLMLIMGSGERKTATFNLASKGVSDFQRQAIQAYFPVLQRHEEDPKEHPKPIEPVHLVNDITHEGLLNKLANGYGSITYLNSEGGMISGGHSMSKEKRMGFFASMNCLWDGGDISYHRATAESTYLHGRRCATLWAFQDSSAQEIIGNQTADDLGLLARFLIARPMPMAGTRLNVEGRTAEQQAVLDLFYSRTAELHRLEGRHSGLDPRDLDPQVLQLAGDARGLLVKYYIETERAQAPGGKYSTIKASASKTAEQAARIAGVFAAWRMSHHEGRNCVTVDDMAPAIELARWFLDEVLRIVPAAQSSSQKRQSDQLLEWIKNNSEDGIITASKIGNFGPSFARTKRRRVELIAELIDIDEIHAFQGADASRGPWKIGPC